MKFRQVTNSTGTRAEAAAYLNKLTYAELRQAVPVGSHIRAGGRLVEVVGHADGLPAGLPAVRAYVPGAGTVLFHEGEFDVIRRGDPDDNA